VGAGARSIVLVAGDGRVLALGELVMAGDALEVRAHVVFPWTAREGQER
jgi:hypothetical protein